MLIKKVKKDSKALFAIPKLYILLRHLMEQFISVYRKLLNLQNATFSLVEHEDAMVAVVFIITEEDGERFVLKISERPNDFLREMYFLNHFDGIIPVPKIIQVVEPSESIHGAILMEYIPGALLQTKELTEQLAYQIGRCLALIHLNPQSGYGDPVQGNLYPDPRVYFTFKFVEGLDECRNHLPNELIEQCLSYYKSNVDLLLSVDGPCIVHRDYRLGNLIVSDGKLQAIIDWAGARVSFAEEDFCFLEHVETQFMPNCKQSFLAGYASIRPIPDYKLVLQLLRLNRAIATIGFTVKRGTWENRSSRVYRYNRQFLETFF